MNSLAQTPTVREAPTYSPDLVSHKHMHARSLPLGCWLRVTMATVYLASPAAAGEVQLTIREELRGREAVES